MQVLSIISCALILCMINGSYAVTSSGNCPEIPVMDFDRARYVGEWFELAKFPNLFEPNLKCVRAVYGDVFLEDGSIDPLKITVKNEGYSNTFGRNSTVDIQGTGTVADVNKPNQLKIKFNILGIIQPEGDYNVLKTDYENYTLVYSCQERDYKFFVRKTEYAWILAREKKIDSKTFNELKRELAKFTDPEALVLTDWAWCGVNNTIVEA